MAKTFANLKSQIRTYLDESSAYDWTDAEVAREANSGYQQVISAVMETYEDFYITTSQLSTVADQQEYNVSSDSLPSDIFKIRRVEINYDVSNSNSVAYKARPESMDKVLSRLGNTNTGLYATSNPIYYLQGFGSDALLGFLPIPTKDGTNAIKLWYVAQQADLSDDTDNVNIPYADRYYAMIAKYAAGVLLRKGQQEEPAAGQYLGEFEADLDKMIRQLEDRLADSNKSIVVTEPILY